MDANLNTNLELPPLLNLTSTASTSGISRAELAKLYGVVEKAVDAYDATNDLRRLNDVTTIAEAEKLGIASEAQRKNLTELLESQSAVYQAIVAKGTAAYVFFFWPRFSRPRAMFNLVLI